MPQKTYKELLRTRLTVESHRISQLTNQAKADYEHDRQLAEFDVHAIINYICGKPADQRKAGIYLIDSICQTVGKIYIKLFSEHIVGLMEATYRHGNNDTRNCCKRILQIWKERKVFDTNLLRQIYNKLREVRDVRPTNNNNNSGSLWGNNSNSIDNPNKDVIVENPPSDAITQVKFSPLQDLFVVTSWSNEVIAYKYDNSGNCGKLGIKKHDKGVLCCAWDNTGQNIFSGGCDNKINIWHSQNGSFKCLGNHNAPIKCIEFSKDHNILMSGSWDRTLKYWNINSGQQAGEIKLNEKVFCMSFLSPILTIGLSNKHVVAYDLRNPSKCVFDKQTVLKYQLRCLDIFPDKKGFAVSSVEGRTAIVHYSGNDDKKKFFI
mmetsp:Transcript_49372/g.60622  ORF Transcript_49372/g.60622 Transcript_49372/m.60622 type:complete len:377 (+) Transcript_49372:55-1185(+)